MKKTINMPEVRVINFRSTDIIATSEMRKALGTSVQNDATTSTNGYNDNMFAPGRGVWD